MDLMTKLQSVFIIIAALIGLAFGYLTGFGDFSIHLIEPFLMVLLYFVFLSVDGKKFLDSFRNLKFMATAVAVNFIWTPIFSFILGILFFRNVIDLQMGLMMLLVTPGTDWYLVFTGLAGGNVALGASILPLNLRLQILLMPIYLFLFFGGNVQYDVASTLISIVGVLILPFFLSLLTKILEKRIPALRPSIVWLRNSGDNGQLLFLCLAVISMFASESKELFLHPVLLLKMLIPLIIFFAVNLFLVQFLGKRLKFAYEDNIALNFTTLARNSPLSLAIAVAAFPDRPLISLALVIGPLIELPCLGIIAGILKKRKVAFFHR